MPQIVIFFAIYENNLYLRPSNLDPGFFFSNAIKTKRPGTCRAAGSGAFYCFLNAGRC